MQESYTNITVLCAHVHTHAHVPMHTHAHTCVCMWQENLNALVFAQILAHTCALDSYLCCVHGELSIECMRACHFLHNVCWIWCVFFYNCFILFIFYLSFYGFGRWTNAQDRMCWWWMGTITCVCVHSDIIVLNTHARMHTHPEISRIAVRPYVQFDKTPYIRHIC